MSHAVSMGTRLLRESGSLCGPRLRVLFLAPEEEEEEEVGPVRDEVHRMMADLDAAIATARKLPLVSKISLYEPTLWPVATACVSPPDVEALLLPLVDVLLVLRSFLDYYEQMLAIAEEHPRLRELVTQRVARLQEGAVTPLARVLECLLEALHLKRLLPQGTREELVLALQSKQVHPAQGVVDLRVRRGCRGRGHP